MFHPIMPLEEGVRGEVANKVEVLK